VAIAFALGVLSLLGNRVPVGLKVFLTALAIVDDIGAVLVIAVFYSGALTWPALAAAAGVVMLLALANKAGVRHPAVYAVLGVALWFAVHASGVHATIAGVLLAFTIPASTRIDAVEFLSQTRRVVREFSGSEHRGDNILTNEAQQNAVHYLEQTCEAAQAPLGRFAHSLHGLVAFGIMPLFALANAGVALRGADAPAFGPAAVGVLLGLVIGKPLGITLFAWAAVRLRAADLPTGVAWPALAGVGVLGGIGFTMSLFVAELAFGAGALLASAKLGILAASLVAGLAGLALLRRSTRGRRERPSGGQIDDVAPAPRPAETPYPH
jgi:Na+:H+ antiporter, NhaA family